MLLADQDAPVGAHHGVRGDHLGDLRGGAGLYRHQRADLGGPGLYPTTNLSYVIYEFAFKYYNIGTASAIAGFTSFFFLIITLVMMRTMGGFGYHEE